MYGTRFGKRPLQWLATGLAGESQNPHPQNPRVRHPLRKATAAMARNGAGGDSQNPHPQNPRVRRPLRKAAATMVRNRAGGGKSKPAPSKPEGAAPASENGRYNGSQGSWRRRTMVTEKNQSGTMSNLLAGPDARGESADGGEAEAFV